MNTDRVVFRVGQDGCIRAVSDGSPHFTSCSVGRPCHQVINAYAPSGARRCNRDCIGTLSEGVSQNQQGGYALVQRRPHRMRCTPVGDEIIVTLTPCIRDTRPDPLTPREGEVLRWVAHGKTSREIANILGISPGTVRIHNERIRTKLDVRTRAQAVATGLSMGILELMESNGESPA